MSGWTKLFPAILSTVMLLGGAAALAGESTSTQKSPGGEPKPEYKDEHNYTQNQDGPPSGPAGKVIPLADWRNAPRKPISPSELDRLVLEELASLGIKPAPLASDEVFLRRVSLDLTGKPPTAAEVVKFVADRDPNKYAQVVEQLLASDGYAKHWGRYWRDAIAVRVTDRKDLILADGFEKWMSNQLAKNVSWDKIAAAMITAEGSALQLPLTPQLKAAFAGKAAKKSTAESEAPETNIPGAALGKGTLARKYAGARAGGAETYKETLEVLRAFNEHNERNGAAFLLLSRTGPDAVVDRASEVSRIFLGIQLQCAQCHDHPFDSWKRIQFHEFAAYFARTDDRKFRNDTGVGVRLVSASIGEHEMPDLKNPSRHTVVHPKFINGDPAGRGLPDKARREKLVAEMTDVRNPWFAAAFVNRMWAELMGQGFYRPVDDIGPQKKAVLGKVLVRLSAAFQAEKYDIRGLLRTIALSETYRRGTGMGRTETEHLASAAIYPSRLPADALWASLETAVGPFENPFVARFSKFGSQFEALADLNPAGRRAPKSLKGQLQFEFQDDPSSNADEVDLTIPQALLMMNNPQLNARLSARGGFGNPTLLSQILAKHSDDAEALRAVYLHVLNRQPTERELARCCKHIAESRSRSEGFEDILWALINSAEFKAKR